MFHPNSMLISFLYIYLHSVNQWTGSLYSFFLTSIFLFLGLTTMRFFFVKIVFLFWRIGNCLTLFLLVSPVYADGSICLDILQNQWSPIYDVAAILTSIQVWLCTACFFFILVIKNCYFCSLVALHNVFNYLYSRGQLLQLRTHRPHLSYYLLRNFRQFLDSKSQGLNYNP